MSGTGYCLPAIWIRDDVVLIMMVGNGIHHDALVFIFVHGIYPYLKVHRIPLVQWQTPWDGTSLHFVDQCV